MISGVVEGASRSLVSGSVNPLVSGVTDGSSCPVFSDVMEGPSEPLVSDFTKPLVSGVTDGSSWPVLSDVMDGSSELWDRSEDELIMEESLSVAIGLGVDSGSSVVERLKLEGVVSGEVTSAEVG